MNFCGTKFSAAWLHSEKQIFVYFQIELLLSINKAFQHVETLFIQGNEVCTDQNKPAFLLTKKVCFDQYELDYNLKVGENVADWA